jgi:ABC-type glycerol-3-phosphate transport system permease component
MSVEGFAHVAPATRPARLTRSLRAGGGLVTHRLAILLLVVWSLLPILWLLVMSTQPERNYRSAPITIRLEDFSLQWFGIMLGKEEFLAAARNSVIIASATMVVTVALGALAAYPLARLRMRGRGLFLGIVIAARMVPSMILAVPMFLLARELRILDTQLVLVAVYTALLLPFATWLLKNYFEQVPLDIEKAARMDGCSRLSTLVRVILPMSIPGVVATAVYMFISAWNSFLFGLILTTRNATPITLILSRQVGGGYQPDDPTVSQLAAAGVLTVVPVLVLMVLLHRHIVRGLIPGSKG